VLFKVIYYVRPNGRIPIKEWRDAQPFNIRANIDAKVRKLAENGLVLLGTAMLDNISGSDEDLYELRNVTLKWRIAVYFDRPINTFVLLHGWRKQQRMQERDIVQARRFLHEYLSGGKL
jgi:hypothetical protein